MSELYQSTNGQAGFRGGLAATHLASIRYDGVRSGLTPVVWQARLVQMPGAVSVLTGFVVRELFVPSAIAMPQVDLFTFLTGSIVVVSGVAVVELRPGSQWQLLGLAMTIPSFELAANGFTMVFL